MKNFYTYLWLREDGTPYYVGKGHGRRAFRKGSPAVDRILLQEFPSEEDAFYAEIFLIAFYGRKDLGTGSLRNLTNGGENPPNAKGKKRTLETRLKMSASLTGRIGGMLGKSHSPETRSRMSKSMQGAVRKPRPHLSDEHKRRIGLANKKRAEERRAKITGRDSHLSQG